MGPVVQAIAAVFTNIQTVAFTMIMSIIVIATAASGMVAFGLVMDEFMEYDKSIISSIDAIMGSIPLDGMQEYNFQ